MNRLAPASAYWLWIGDDFKFQRTDGDVAATGTRTRAVTMPGDEDFATMVESPRSFEEMEQLFAKFELGADQ